MARSPEPAPEDPAVLLVGCGRMGGALLRGWRRAGRRLFVLDPSAGEQEGAVAVSRPADVQHLPRPLIVVLAVKPKVAEAVAREITPFCGAGVVWVSIAAGITLRTLEGALKPAVDILRAMPNTAVDVGAGAMALVAGDQASAAAALACERLFSAVGLVIRLEREDQMDAATAVSGSGPAYVFAFTEALALAGERLGLSPAVASALARQTLVGAGALAAGRDPSLAFLRAEVTSPGGTTAAGLERLGRTEALATLVIEAAAAAAARSKALGAPVETFGTFET